MKDTGENPTTGADWRDLILLWLTFPALRQTAGADAEILVSSTSWCGRG